MHIKELANSKATLSAIVVAVVGVAAVLYAWQLPPFATSVQTTNNAYVKGKVTLIASQLGGYVVDVPFTDYRPVKKGDVLVKLDDRIYQQQLRQAEATLAQQQNSLGNFDANRASKVASVDLAKAQLSAAQAALKKAQNDADRNQALSRTGVTTEATADQVHAALMQAQAGVAQAQASLDIARQNLALQDDSKPALEEAVKNAEAAVEVAKINLGNTEIVAPVDGELGEVTARVGQYVSTGTQLTSVTPSQTWVIANFKETQTADMKVGQQATFTVDALNGARLTGYVSEISPAAGSEFSVLKPDNATGNFTKIAQRIPLRIELDPNQQLSSELRPGMSVEVAIDTAAPPVHAEDDGTKTALGTKLSAL